jgi:hypothetical protein
MKHDKNMQNKKQRNEENFNMKKTTWAYESIPRKQMEKQRNEEFLKGRAKKAPK